MNEKPLKNRYVGIYSTVGPPLFFYHQLFLLLSPCCLYDRNYMYVGLCKHFHDSVTITVARSHPLPAFHTYPFCSLREPLLCKLQAKVELYQPRCKIVLPEGHITPSKKSHNSALLCVV